jgi:hypothetical protein
MSIEGGSSREFFINQQPTLMYVQILQVQMLTPYMLSHHRGLLEIWEGRTEVVIQAPSFDTSQELVIQEEDEDDEYINI